MKTPREIAAQLRLSPLSPLSVKFSIFGLDFRFSVCRKRATEKDLAAFRTQITSPESRARNKAYWAKVAEMCEGLKAPTEGGQSH